MLTMPSTFILNRVPRHYEIKVSRFIHLKWVLKHGGTQWSRLEVLNWYGNGTVTDCWRVSPVSVLKYNTLRDEIHGEEPPMRKLIAATGYLLVFCSGSGTLNLTMKWGSPSHLDVTYNGHAATLDHQVVKSGAIDISVQDLSSVTANTLQ